MGAKLPNVILQDIQIKGHSMKNTSRFAVLASVALFALGGCDENGANKDAAASTVQEEAAQQPDLAQNIPAPATVAAENVPVPGALVTLKTENARSYATADGAKTGAVFIDITNGGTVADKLLGASTGKAVRVELHESAVDESTGVMAMRKVDAIDLPAGQTTALVPGGYHIMLFDLPMPLQQGETYDVTLEFENADKITVPVSVIAPGSTAAAPHDHMHGDDGNDQPEE